MPNFKIFALEWLSYSHSTQNFGSNTFDSVGSGFLDFLSRASKSLGLRFGRMKAAVPRLSEPTILSFSLTIVQGCCVLCTLVLSAEKKNNAYYPCRECPNRFTLVHFWLMYTDDSTFALPLLKKCTADLIYLIFSFLY